MTTKAQQEFMELEKDVEKITGVELGNKYVNLGITDEEASFYDKYPEAKRRKIIRKIDVRLVPFLALLYLAAHIDRANIGNAKIEGLNDDLGLDGVKYNIVLSIFFVPYILLEVPSNVMLKKFKRPSTYMGLLVVSWGTIMTFHGIVKNFAGLMVVRVLLGIAEAGFFPGAVFLITQWYVQTELQFRIALFYCSSALSGAFSGLLAFAIAKMDGIGGRPGWAWIFLLEGMATVVIGCFCFCIMPDTPSLSGKWLEPEEIKYLEIQNLIREGGRTHEKLDKFRWCDVWALVTDYKVYCQAWILFMCSTCSYGLKFTMPSITKSMGYTSSQAQLLTMPPYIAGAISALGFSFLSDKYQWRMSFIVGQVSLITIGFAIILPLAANITHRIAGCYVGVVLICIGQYPTNPAGSAWISGNLAGPSKKAMGIALNICIGNAGGIVGSYIFLDSEAPGYRTGFSVGLVFSLLAICTALFVEFSYWRINKKRDAMDKDEIMNTYSEDQLARMGDKSPLFRYKL